jgi:hypothetical protein
MTFLDTTTFSIPSGSINNDEKNCLELKKTTESGEKQRYKVILLNPRVFDNIFLSTIKIPLESRGPP